MDKNTMDFEPWAWESDNWSGDSDGQLAIALARARAQESKPLKLTKLPHRDQTSLIDYEEKPQKKEFKKDSCCCGATKKKPCKCMYTGAKCSSVKPMCACYKDIEESKGHMSFAESEDDKEDMVSCNHCWDKIGNEKEVYVDETVEYEMANGELVCVPCYKIWMKEYKNDLDPLYTPFYGEPRKPELISNKRLLGSLAIVLSLASLGTILSKRSVNVQTSDAEDFKPHMMYNPTTGKGYKANSMDDHLRMEKMGYTHDAPKKDCGCGCKGKGGCK